MDHDNRGDRQRLCLFRQSAPLTEPADQTDNGSHEKCHCEHDGKNVATVLARARSTEISVRFIYFSFHHPTIHKKCALRMRNHPARLRARCAIQPWKMLKITGTNSNVATVAKTRPPIT